MQLLPVPVACSTAAFPFCSNAAATFAYASALTLFKLIGIVFLPPGAIFLQRIFLINLLWQKALSCQAFPAKKKISDKKCDIFSIIFWSSQPTSGIASGILKTKHRTTAGRSPPAMPCFSAAQRLCLRNVPPPRRQLRNTKTACRTFPSADGLQLRQKESKHIFSSFGLRSFLGDIPGSTKLLLMSIVDTFKNVQQSDPKSL